MTSWQGAAVGKYKLERLLGEGGMGSVWLATDPLLGRQVAIKLLGAGVRGNQDLVQRFLREARTVAGLQSPHTVRIFDVGVLPDETPYIVMEYLQGDDLAALVKRGGPLALGVSVDYVVQACEALAEAHALGVVHRDIKTHNLILHEGPDHTSSIKLLDFGIAKVEDNSVKTHTHAMMGTPAYMSPEQMRSSGTVDPRTDLWSLGVVLHELLLAKLPFDGESMPELIMAVSSNPLPALPTTLPTGIRTIIQRCLEKDPAARYKNVAELAAALAPFAQDKPLAAHLVGRARRYLKLGLGAASTVVAEAPTTPQVVPKPDQPEPIADATPGKERWRALEEAIPKDMVRSFVPLLELFAEMFTFSTQVGEGVVQLFGSSLASEEDHDFFAIFMSDTALELGGAAMGVLGHETFAAYVKPLRSYIEKLESEKRRVVIVVSRSGELGEGVRESISEYRRELNTFVIPVWIREIEEAYRRGHLWEAFENRLHDLHANPDPFSDSGGADPMRYVGMGPFVNKVLKHLQDGERILSITALPGSGKSTLVKLVRYNLGARQFVSVHCTDVKRMARALGHEIIKAIERLVPGASPSGPAKVPTASDSLDPLTLPAVGTRMLQTSLSGVTGTNRRPVLVLEDADWFVAHVTHGRAPEVDDARRLWSALGEVCRKKELDVIVTSVRGRELSAAAIGEWQNPARPSIIAVPLLNSRETAHMVHELSSGVAELDRNAVAELDRQGGGNVGLTLGLCSDAFRERAKQEDRGPLESVTIGGADIRAAAARMASFDHPIGPMYDSLLTGDERNVLCTLAHAPAPSLDRIRAALPEPRAAEPAMKGLEAMGIIASDGKRYRVAIPVVAEWAKRHIERPLIQRENAWRKRTRTLAVGLAITAVLFSTYYVWLHDQRDVARTPDKVHGCNYKVDAPERAERDKAVKVFLHQWCDPEVALKPLSITVEDSATVDISPRGDCTGKTDCMYIARVELDLDHDGIYRFHVNAAGTRVLDFKIVHDGLAGMKTRLQDIFAIASFLPFALGLCIAFYGDVLAAVRGLFKRDAPSPAAPQPPPATPPPAS